MHSSRLRHGLSLLLERAMRWWIHPRLRAATLRLLGATVGRNVRVYEVVLFNLQDGFRNLSLADDVHVGTGCLLDLKGPLRVARGAVLGPGVTVLTHQDPGQAHASPLTRDFPATIAAVEIGEFAWIGARAILLPGTSVGQRAVVGAGAVVTGPVAERAVVAGVPARQLRQLD